MGKKQHKNTPLSEVSNRYIEDRELRDAPSRLYRQLLVKLSMTPIKWTKLLRDYLDWVVTTKDPTAAKIERTTRSGNIKDTYFQKPTLSFAKLIEGMSIVRVKTATITITCEMEDGSIVEVEERVKLLPKTRLENGFKQD